jgi:hypothetical protein
MIYHLTRYKIHIHTYNYEILNSNLSENIQFNNINKLQTTKFGLVIRDLDNLYETLSRSSTTILIKQKLQTLHFFYSYIWSQTPKSDAPRSHLFTILFFWYYYKKLIKKHHILIYKYRQHKASKIM